MASSKVKVMYTVDMLNTGLERQVLRDWWESHWSAQDTNKHSRPHAYPTGSFCEYMARCLMENVENADVGRWRYLFPTKGTLAIASVAKTRSKRTQ